MAEGYVARHDSDRRGDSVEHPPGAFGSGPPRTGVGDEPDGARALPNASPPRTSGLVRRPGDSRVVALRLPVLADTDTLTTTTALTTEAIFPRVIGALDRAGIPYMLTGKPDGQVSP